jgi:hypothetical protein
MVAISDVTGEVKQPCGAWRFLFSASLHSLHSPLLSGKDHQYLASDGVESPGTPCHASTAVARASSHCLVKPSLRTPLSMPSRVTPNSATTEKWS